MQHCITIYTDASVCPETQGGGWACWIKAAPGETHLASGIFKTPVKSSTEAELRAIANGLVVANKVFDTKDKTIVVVTDSQESIDFINGKIAGGGKKAVNPQIAQQIKELIPANSELRVNKVKAHSNKDGKRSFVNNLVDRAARAEMRKGRKIINLTTNGATS